MKNSILSMFGLGIVVGLVMAPVASATVSSDDFESYTAGTWDTTEMAANGWAYFDANESGQTIGNAFGRTGQGVQYASTLDATPVWGRASPDGRIEAAESTASFWFNVQTFGSLAQMGFWNSGNGTLAQLNFRSGGDVDFTTEGGSSTLGQWAGGWHHAEVEFDFANDQARGRLDGGTWSAFDDTFSNRVVVPYVQSFVFSRGSDVYFDDFNIPSVPFSEPMPATIYTWATDGSGDWNKSGNWAKDGDGSVPNAGNHTAIFGSAIMSPRTAFTDTDVTVNRIEFSNTAHSYAVSGHGSVNLFATTDPNSPVNPSISVQGTHLFQAAVNLHAPTTADVASGSLLTFDGALNLSGTTLTKTGDGTLTINNRVTLGGGSVINAQGVISGVGTIGGDVVNDGTISPGNSQAIADGDAPGQVPEPGALLLLLMGTLAWTWQSWICRN